MLCTTLLCFKFYFISGDNGKVVEVDDTNEPEVNLLESQLTEVLLGGKRHDDVQQELDLEKPEDMDEVLKDMQI